MQAMFWLTLMLGFAAFVAHTETTVTAAGLLICACVLGVGCRLRDEIRALGKSDRY